MAISEHLSIQHLRCRYKPGKSGIIIVDGRGRLRVELTKIYWSIARGSSDASARSVVSALHRFLMWADHLSLDFRADHDKIKQVVDLILEQLTKERDTFSCLSGSRKYRVRAVGDGVTEVHLFHRSTGNCSRQTLRRGSDRKTWHHQNGLRRRESQHGEGVPAGLAHRVRPAG